MKRLVLLMLVLSVLLLIVSCGGGGGGSAVPVKKTSHSVTLNWEPNRETGVNSPNGGYLVSISTKPTTTIDVPYVSGPTTTTTTNVVLDTGSYSVTVRAYAALDAQGGSAGNVSAASSKLTVRVP
jgi:hypothetical protein